MINIRRANERGHANYGWLDTYYTFSFNNYYDPSFMGFRTLRVMNEDFIEHGRGFPKHGHQDMEILTYVIRGAIAHKDSTGGEGVLKPHEIQRMSAGTGVMHSEYNASDEGDTHLYQIWIVPEKNGIEPGYEQKFINPDEKRGALRVIASRAGTDGAVKIYQDVTVYSSILAADQEMAYSLADGRHAWVQVVSGSLDVNDEHLNVSDGAAISDETNLEIKSLEDDTEFLLFDLN